MPPLEVMQVAEINLDNGIIWSRTNVPRGSYLFMCIHFAELKKLQANETREFVINLDNEHFHGPMTPSYLKATNVCSAGIYGPQDMNFVEYKPTNGSTLFPIVNAIEIYTVVQLSSWVTDDTDTSSLLAIRNKYPNKITKPWSGDPCLPLNYTWEGLVCSNNASSPRVISLNLAGNNLSGSIPDFLANLTQLTDLDLSHNNLTGSVPIALLRKNQDRQLNLSISGNEQLLCFSRPCDASSPSKKNNLVIIIGLSVLAAILSLLVLSLVIVIRTKKRKLVLDQKCTAFTYSEVVQMTNNFTRRIGEGGYGPVFHGHLLRQVVAVKILADKSKQGSKEFQTEIALLSRVHHRNLVSFLGYCDERENMILVYEFLPKGNLRETLSGKTHPSLAWKQRLQIALDAAQGLEYLHSFCKPAIIHRDVKSTNILLSDNLEAKLADFGLSKSDIPDGVSHVSSVVAGTPGYLDPEYFSTSWLNEKSDVFSFGVVLLELVSGKEPVMVELSGTRIHLSEWVRGHLLKGNHEKVADPNLDGRYNVPSFWRVVGMALECTRDKGTERPSMNTIVTELREVIAMCNIMLNSENSDVTGQQKSEASISSYNSNSLIHEEIQSNPAPR